MKIENAHITQQYSFDELEKRISNVAAKMACFDELANGSRILLLYPPGLEFYIGFLTCIRQGQ